MPEGPAGHLASRYTPEVWAALLLAYAPLQNIPLPFAVEWLREESGGNPCDIGNPEQYGPDGAPREMGIAQFYNPDDLQFLKITSTQLRAYCSPEKVPYRVKRKDGTIVTVMGPSKEVIRPLTSDEMQVQAKATCDKIAQSRSYAAHYAALAGVKWPSGGVDFWRLVKLVHGLPGLVSSGLAHVATYLGRAPSSWAEFRHAIESGAVHCDANTEAHRGDDNFGSIFANAEKATSAMHGQANV